MAKRPKFKRPGSLERQCVVCKVIFETKRSHAQFCSDRCKKILSRARQREQLRLFD